MSEDEKDQLFARLRTLDANRPNEYDCMVAGVRVMLGHAALMLGLMGMWVGPLLWQGVTVWSLVESGASYVLWRSWMVPALEASMWRRLHATIHEHGLGG